MTSGGTPIAASMPLSASRSRRSDSVLTRCGRPMASVQSTATPAARARARTASSFIRCSWPRGPGRQRWQAPQAAGANVFAGAGAAFEQQVTRRRIDRTVVAAEIADQRQHRTVAQTPARRDAGRADSLAPKSSARRQDAAPGQRRAAPAAGGTARACRHRRRRGPAALEGRERVGIGDRFGRLAVVEAGEGRELAPPPFAHRLGQLAVMVGEEQEGRAAAALLAHEDQRDLRAEELQGDRGLERRGIDALDQPVAERPVADLVVVLQEQHERGGRQVGAGRAARARPCDRPRARPGRRSLRPGSAPGARPGARHSRRSSRRPRRSAGRAGRGGRRRSTGRRSPAADGRPRCRRARARDGHGGPARRWRGPRPPSRPASRVRRWRARRRSAGRRSGIPSASRARSR